MKKKKVLPAMILCLAMFLFACKKTPYGDNPAAGKYYSINGFKMYCETYGHGKPLLLIHGNGGSINTFSGVIPFFSKRYKVIVADSRAHGRSLDPQDSLTFEQMADDYAKLLDRLHVDSADIFGWSDGGIIAIEMAMHHPNKVKRLAASGANLWPDATALEPDAWAEQVKDYNALVNKPNKTAEEERRFKFVKLDYEEPHIALADLHKIECPALIMGGDRDVIQQKHLKLIADNISGAELWIVPNSGHGVLFDHKYKFMWGLNKFFSK